MNNNSEKVGIAVSVRDLFWYILCRWRVLIICIAVGAIVLGAYSGYKSVRNGGSLQEQAENIMSGMSAMDLANAQNNATTFIHYLNMYEYYSKYDEKSLFQKLNPSSAMVRTLVYHVKPVGDTIEDPSTIINAYKNGIKNDALAEKVAGEWGISKDDAFYYYDGIVTVSGMDSISENPTDVSNEKNDSRADLESEYSFTVYIYGEDEEFTERMGSIVKENITELASDIAEKNGEHTLTLVSEQNGRSDGTYLYEKQEEKVTQTKFLLASANELAAALDENMLTAVKYLLKEQYDGDYIDVLFPGGLETSGSGFKISKKLAAAGALLGLILAVIIIILKYLAKGVIRNYSDLEYTYGVQVLGTYEEQNAAAKRHKTALDRALWKKRLGHGIRTYEESIDLIASRIELAAENCKFTKVCLAFGEEIKDNESFAKDVMDRLQNKGVTVTAAPNVLRNAAAGKSLSDAQTVAVVCQTDRTKFARIDEMFTMCDSNKITVLGMIVAE